MLTATGYIASDNWNTPKLLYTNPSGVRSEIIDVYPQPFSTTPFSYELLEVYPTGVEPNLNLGYIDSGILLRLRSDHDVQNVRVRCKSYNGSQITVRASGEMFLVVNYINVDLPIESWPGYNWGRQNGKMY